MKTAFAARRFPLGPPLIPDPPETCAPRDDFAGLVATDRAAREEILHRAYAIWEREGRPQDCALTHWLQAEAAALPHASASGPAHAAFAAGT